MNAPTAPGRYLISVNGDLKGIKVIQMNGELYAVQHRWLFFPNAVPLNKIQGRWIDADVRSKL